MVAGAERVSRVLGIAAYWKGPFAYPPLGLSSKVCKVVFNGNGIYEFTGCIDFTRPPEKKQRLALFLSPGGKKEDLLQARQELSIQLQGISAGGMPFTAPIFKGGLFEWSENKDRNIQVTHDPMQGFRVTSHVEEPGTIDIDAKKSPSPEEALQLLERFLAEESGHVDVEAGAKRAIYRLVQLIIECDPISILLMLRKFREEYPEQKTIVEKIFHEEVVPQVRCELSCQAVGDEVKCLLEQGRYADAATLTHFRAESFDPDLRRRAKEELTAAFYRRAL